MKRAIFLLGLLFSSFFIVFSPKTLVLASINHEFRTEADKHRFLNGLTPHDSISIANDTGLEIFPGNGTASNPYAIENLEIVAEGDYEIAISISRTTKYFVIKNCFLQSNSTGIELYRVTNGTARIENSILVAGNNKYIGSPGILLDHSQNVSVVRNQFEYWGNGLFIANSDYANIQSNNGSFNTVGIHAGSSPHSRIKSNVFLNNERDAIYLSHCSYSQILDNTFDGKEFYIGESDVANYSTYTVTNNYHNGYLVGYIVGANGLTINTNVYGYFYLIACNNLLVQNLYFNQVFNPLHIINCINFRIENCFFNDTQNGIIIEGGNSSIITQNTVRYSRIGILVDNHDTSEFSYNIIQENEYYGMFFGSKTSMNTIHHNYFIDNLQGYPYVESQAYDNGGWFDSTAPNIWYDTTTNQGNFWSDFEVDCKNRTAYNISGYVSNIDPYPLTVDLEGCRKDTKGVSAPILALLTIPFIAIVLRRKKLIR